MTFKVRGDCVPNQCTNVFKIIRLYGTVCRNCCEAGVNIERSSRCLAEKQSQYSRTLINKLLGQFRRQGSRH